MKRKKIFTKDNFEVGTLIGFFLLSEMALTPNVNADEIKHKFKNPSFSGIGTASHYLTVENQEFSRKKEIEDALAAAKKAAEEAAAAEAARLAAEEAAAAAQKAAEEAAAAEAAAAAATAESEEAKSS